jgi:hypothetical protein
MPSENAATPAASTKAANLMDTLYRAFSASIDCPILLSSFQPQASSSQHLSRYTCRERNRLNSREINNITKNFSIHFSCVREGEKRRLIVRALNGRSQSQSQTDEKQDALITEKSRQGSC